MTTDGLLEVLQADLRRLAIETAWAAAIAAIAALCGVVGSSLVRGEFWYFRRTRRALAWGAAVGIAAWLVTLFGTQLIPRHAPQAAVAWYDDRGLWLVRLAAASAAAAIAAFRAHQRTLQLVDQAKGAPRLASFRLRHLLAIQGAVAIVLCGWLASAKSRLPRTSWDDYLARREQLARRQFEPYGLHVQIERDGILSLSSRSGRGRPVADEALQEIAGFGRIRALSIRSDWITHEGLVHLNHLDDLRELRIVTHDITPEEGAALAGLQSLAALEIDCRVFDESAAAALSASASLRHVSLRKAPLTDEGLAHLAAMPNLYSLSLEGTLVTAQGVVRFQELRPDVLLLLAVPPRAAPPPDVPPLIQAAAPGQGPDID